MRVSAARSRREEEEAAQSRTMRALNSALQTLQSLLASSGDIFGAGPAPAGPAGGAAASPAAALQRAPAKSKWVTWSGSASSTRDVAQPPAGRRLDAYLVLPPEEYNVLDPRWVTRLDEGAFRLSLPLGSMLQELYGGLPPPEALASLVPAITVRTRLDGAAVVLSGEDASLGSAEADQLFNLTFTTRLGWSGGPPAGAPPPAQQPTLYTVTVASGDGVLDCAPAAAAADAAAEPAWTLRLTVKASGGVAVPSPLSALPGLLLGGAGSLFCRAVLQAMLPRFADLLMEDFGRWSRSEERTAGLLIGAAALAPQQLSEAEAEAEDGQRAA